MKNMVSKSSQTLFFGGGAGFAVVPSHGAEVIAGVIASASVGVGVNAGVNAGDGVCVCASAGVGFGVGVSVTTGLGGGDGVIAGETISPGIIELSCISGFVGAGVGDTNVRSAGVGDGVGVDAGDDDGADSGETSDTVPSHAAGVDGEPPLAARQVLPIMLASNIAATETRLIFVSLANLSISNF